MLCDRFDSAGSFRPRTKAHRRSARQGIVTLVFLVVVTAVTATFCRSAVAKRTIHWVHIDGNFAHSVQEFDEGDWWYVILEISTNKIIYAEEIPTGNPNPEGDDQPEPGDEDSKEALAKQKGKKMSDAEEMKSDLEKYEESPVGKAQTGKGKGYRVVSNPADEVTLGGGDGDSSDTSFTDLLDKFKFDVAKVSPHAGQGAEGFDPNGESMGTYVRGLIKKGDQGDDGGDSTPPGWQAAQWKRVLPQLAEIYKPNPEEAKKPAFLLIPPAQAAAPGKAGHAAKKALPSLQQVLRGLGAFGPGGARPAAPRPPAAARPVR